MIAFDRYPREITLRDGARLVLRPMVREDVERLWEFFRRISPEDKMYLRHDVSRREVIEEWGEKLDYDHVLPIFALEGDRVVGDATLHRDRNGWKQRIGTIRIQIAEEFRNRGLGTVMIREMRHLGEKAALQYLVAEAIEEQHAAIRAFEKLGFERVAFYRNFVNDQKGRFHNLVVLHYPMSRADEEMSY